MTSTEDVWQLVLIVTICSWAPVMAGLFADAKNPMQGWDEHILDTQSFDHRALKKM